MLRNAGAALAAALLLVPAASMAQPPAPPEAAGAAQEWSLSELMTGFAAVKSSDRRFVETKYSSLLSDPIVVKGTLKYIAPNRIEKHASSPYEEALVVDSDRLTLENKSKGLKRALALSQYPVVWAFVEGIRATLAGDLDTLKRFYKVRFEGARRQWTLHLEPIEPQMSEIVRSIQISGESDQIKSIEIQEAGGDRSVMIIG